MDNELFKELSFDHTDEIFRKLGFKKVTNNRNEIIYKSRLVNIKFFMDFHHVYLTMNSSEGEVNESFMSMEMLQAINRKCMELGWI